MIIQTATENDVPIQLHSGLFGNCGNDPQKGNPLQLINIFSEYSGTKFILFHGSYPFSSEMAAVVRGFPNVFLDICWTPWMLHNNLQKYLSEWLALIPCNKILVGGDSECIERVYAAMITAKKCVAEVLADYVQRGTYSKRMAMTVARKMFRENAQAVYGL
jgi:predicted TIM-barrel fold metal-dependent hydrolase